MLLDEDYVIMGDDKINIITKKKFTLFNFVRGVIEELSSIGPPDIRNFAIKELENDNESSLKIFTTEELEKKLKERMNKTKKPCKICGEDSRSPEFDKPKDICIKCYKGLKEN